MSKRNRTHEVHQKKGPKRMVITQEQILTMDRAARRQAQIESGVNPSSGCGVHGGGKRERNRRDRQEARRQAKNWRNDLD